MKVGWLIALNMKQFFNAGKISGEWLEDSQGKSFFCQSVFEALTEDEASVISADRSGPRLGCRGMGWKISTTMPLRGSYIDSSNPYSYHQCI